MVVQHTAPQIHVLHVHTNTYVIGTHRGGWNASSLLELGRVSDTEPCIDTYTHVNMQP